MQLLREAPESKPFFPAPRRNPYIQSLMGKLKEDGTLDLAAIDWNAFEIADVTGIMLQALSTEESFSARPRSVC